MRRLTAKDYAVDAVTAAKALVGAWLCRRLEDGTVMRRRITETESSPPPRASASPTPPSATKTANGAIVPKTIAKRVIRKLYDICPILERSTKYNVKGNLAIPYYDESETAITVAFQD